MRDTQNPLKETQMSTFMSTFFHVNYPKVHPKLTRLSPIKQVISVGTADEIAKIANDSGFKFTGSELKNNDGVRMLIRVIYELITD